MIIPQDFPILKDKENLKYFTHLGRFLDTCNVRNELFVLLI